MSEDVCESGSTNEGIKVLGTRTLNRNSPGYFYRKVEFCSSCKKLLPRESFDDIRPFNVCKLCRKGR